MEFQSTIIISPINMLEHMYDDLGTHILCHANGYPVNAKIVDILALDVIDTDKYKIRKIKKIEYSEYNQYLLSIKLKGVKRPVSLDLKDDFSVIYVVKKSFVKI